MQMVNKLKKKKSIQRTWKIEAYNRKKGIDNPQTM